MSVELHLPAVYLDSLIEDPVPEAVGDAPILINMDPEAGEHHVPKNSDVYLEVAALGAADTVDLTATQVFIKGVLAFNGGVFQAGFDGPGSAHSNPQPDVLAIRIDPTTDFLSEELVDVRAISKVVGGVDTLDTTYQFKIADTTAPRIASARAIDLNRVRIRFNENVRQDSPTSASSATNYENWTLDRLGDYITPLVSASVVRVEPGAGLDVVDLITDIPLTPNGTYRVTVANVEDIVGNPVEAPDNTSLFLGWSPPSPAGRDFDLYRKLPVINRQEDDTLDLFRFIACIQEVAGLLLYDVDRFVEILDPDTAPEHYVDAMLRDLGNPFEFDLSVDDKRRLAKVLVEMYRLKGTSTGIVRVIRFFLGLEVTVEAFNSSGSTWVLGDSEVGVTAILGTSDPSLLYSFTVTSYEMLSANQRKQIRSIVEYMKPAHTHFVKLVEPTVPIILDHLELGLSELGESWYLH